MCYVLDMLTAGLLRLMNRLFPGKTEIQKVEAALRRYNEMRNAKVRRFFDEEMTCCAHCAFPELNALDDKIERTEKWLAILKMKDTKKHGTVL